MRPTRLPRLVVRAAVLALGALALGACGGDSEVSTAPVEEQPVRNVILLIGDGMGASHRTAARLFSVGGDGQLAMDTLPVSGMARTWATDSVVTESAAAGTAMATGVKTASAALGLDADGRPIETILERAQRSGRAVGLVTDAPLVDATPASFAAHNADRHAYLEIAVDLMGHDVNVLLGGGEDVLLPQGTAGCFPDDGDRTDGRNLVQEATDRGYRHVCTAADLAAVDPANTDLLLGTFADYAMGRPQSPALVEMTDRSIDILSRDPDGFFLMVEGGQIDSAAHSNDALNALGDTIAFDRAVRAALEFQAHHRDTLVIVTADHATGGLSIKHLPTDPPCSQQQAGDGRECVQVIAEDGPFTERGGVQFWVDWTTIHHDGTDVPVTAGGPHAGSLAGYYENTHIFDVMREAMALPE